MAGSILRRVTLLLAAAAFLLATALPGASVSAAPMPAARHCGDCAPAKRDPGKMACGALACVGVAVGLPALHASYLPAYATLIYAPAPVAQTIGAAPSPDPFPPRPIALR